MSPQDLSATLAAPGQPLTLFRALDARFAALIGHRLFTLLVVAPGGEEVERVYSSNPAAYPLQGRKRMGPTPWGAKVLRGGEPFLGRDRAAIEWAFPDHATITALGLGSAINHAVRYDGETLGTINLLDGEGVYDEAALAAAAPYAPLLVPAFLVHRRTMSR